jgi:DNA repair photolyase
VLFAIEPSPKLVGIARLAQQSTVLRAKTDVEYLDLPSRGILNRCSNPRMPFAWTINPYRGCEFGCKYCYARYTHEFMGLEDGELFERRIYAKQYAAQILRGELRRHREGSIAIGTSTDPYQPAERRFEVTRSILEVFAREQGRSVSITTKSDLVARDIDLLDTIRRRNVLHVNMTVTTTDAELARKLEPRAPRPGLRLEAVRQLAARGISVGVFAMPIMPLLTDSLENLSAVAKAAEQAGARYFGGGTLFLMPCAQAQFFPFLEKEFPSLARRYRERYTKRPYLRGEYAKLIQERVQRVRANHHLASAPQPYQPEEWTPQPQRTLFG